MANFSNMNPWQVWKSMVESNYTSMTQLGAAGAILLTPLGESGQSFPSVIAENAYGHYFQYVV